MEAVDIGPETASFIAISLRRLARSFGTVRWASLRPLHFTGAPKRLPAL